MFVESDLVWSTHPIKKRFEKFRSLVDRGIISHEELSQAIKDSERQNDFIESHLEALHVPHEEILQCLAEYYKVPFVEFSEKVVISEEVIASIDLELCKKSHWVPLSIEGNDIHVIAYQPEDIVISEQVKKVFQVNEIRFNVALPADIIRIIDHNQDINPGFPPPAGRTPLARLRTWMANERTILAQHRTTLAKGRTGLAMVRTGLAFTSIALLLLRLFGIGLLLPVEILLIGFGFVMGVDGVAWYLPARKIGNKRLVYKPTESTFGTTILEFNTHDNLQDYRRTPVISGAEILRAGWNRLTPVMKRRFLACDRTDFAEERTFLASYRTVMAKARTGLAFIRTGIAFIGLGIAFFRQFPQSAWTFFDVGLILFGIAMILEGFYWYAPGRQAGNESLKAVQQNSRHLSLWDFMFRPFNKQVDPDELLPALSTGETISPGIWGTTGLALERTLIADRRNIKSCLRTIMARARTGMAFIRTGTSIFSVGLGLLVYFGLENGYWSIFNIFMIVTGIIFIVDGFYWYLPDEKKKKQFPYCYADMEIKFQEY